jgi:hypothetical protein
MHQMEPITRSLPYMLIPGNVRARVRVRACAC